MRRDPQHSWLAGVPAAPGRSVADTNPAFLIEAADDTETVQAYRRMRRRAFVDEQALFRRHDLDRVDADPRTVVLVARGPGGDVLGGVRLGPATSEADLGWWHGGRLVVARGRTGSPPGVGAALVRAACAYAITAGALRFDADIQARNETFFARLGWRRVRELTVADAPHVRMRFPIERIAALVAATKAPLAGLLEPLVDGVNAGGPGFRGDDGAPVPDSDLIAACDAVLPSMVDRDPAWAGWCAVLVNVNDLAAMGAVPVGILDAVGARDVAHATKILEGLRAAATAYGVPVLGGHTTLGVPGSLAVTALGRAQHPIPGGGGSPGDQLRLSVDLGGGWRPGYGGRQWDSTSTRSRADLAAMVGSVAAARPAAAKDVSMVGIIGTIGMLAEASGCGADVSVSAIPRPTDASVGDWLTCFPGFAMVTATNADAPIAPAGPATTARCGSLRGGAGVRLFWPDGEFTTAITAGVTGMGPA
ncbi:MAG: MSMEG_0567/sll0787 family protein [Sporichthyaceae bacterium]